MINPILIWLERLSLDAVIVAVIWGIALGKMAESPLDLWPVIVLALATWLTYVADRLWDVRPGRPLPETDRHRYYKNHYKAFLSLWLGVFVVSVIVAVLDLPLWKWAGGWIIVAGVVGYLALLARKMTPSGRLLLKRAYVPVIFTGGVGWMSECWRVPEGWLAMGILLFGALGNILIISYWESHDVSSRPQWLVPACWFSLVGLAALSTATLPMHIPLGSIGLFIAVSYALLMVKIRPGSTVHVRAFADAVLAAGGVLLFLPH